MSEVISLPEQLIFGLDIGTRSIVGTVGYKQGDDFYVVTQYSKEHDTRAMLDGQIHDIHKVGATIAQVKEKLEERIGRPLTEACIAAAGRVLRTVTVFVEQEFTAEKEVTGEDVYALDSLGIERAYETFLQENDTDMKFYCVGYSVVSYYMNNYLMGNLEGHKAKKIGADLIATFLPDDVVDGLYKAVGLAGLEVANLTLEPIAAIRVAIPEMYRMLNIALVDVGAGTSDISITKDGSIIAYGMIPIAGDALTEIIARHCLVDFTTAEMVKRQADDNEFIEYKDIMGLPQTVSRAEILEVTSSVVHDMAHQVAEKIRELNGGKSVSAVFVVGGGGRMPGYTEALAEELGIVPERVAVRGEEVMQGITFLEEDARKDSLMVTPIGICMSYYEKNNNFIFAYFNEQRIKLYDNNKLAVVDAAMQAKFPNEGLFPKRGEALHFYVNDKPRIARGALGEAAQITVNGKEADIHTRIHANDHITVKESTAGAAATMDINELPEYGATMWVEVNDKKVELPKFAVVNGELQSGYYGIHQEDKIEFLNYYTVRQVADFMDVIIDPAMNIYVNNKTADVDTKVYENFSLIWTAEALPLGDLNDTENSSGLAEHFADLPEDEMSDDEPTQASGQATGQAAAGQAQAAGQVQADSQAPTAAKAPVSMQVIVNGAPVRLSGKPEYVFVDVFDHIDFDLSAPRGSAIVTTLNGRTAQYMEPLHAGDVLEIYWKA